MMQLIAALQEARWPEEMAIYIAGIARLLDEERERPACAWCRRDAGQPMGEGSHGICARHAEQVLVQAKMRKLARRVA